ncbi:cell wall hydrolase [Agrobacterium larrymoorei]|uniref:cell wall hydrolase n=1 Tax=Agrobacterium larrymoorei TaxID=160699 RepID=UPI001571FB68|nr:cell wall hydrolase [Agrobacterium larrymoorei]NTJ41485.1 cell wall hydrolase [Agrobacterium larrymoorei]
MRQDKLSRRGSSIPFEKWASPIVFGLAAWLAFPSLAARADLASLLAGLDAGGEQWRMVLTNSPAGSVHSASLAFNDATETAAIKGSGMTLPDGRKVAFVSNKGGKETTPDSARVNRAAKKGRVVATEVMQPPKAFTAGSVLQRTSMIDIEPLKRKDQAAFVKRKKSSEIELASFYFRRDDKKADKTVSPMLADLITNRSADVLATAYAPPEPDFARQSPFDAILRKPDAGRFIPPISADDHAWAATPLPADAFSAAEQQCLASGIYFEARGESVKGQAAVAQVILNRVRNPAYPKTICGVVYQNKDWRNRCQFSFACDNIKDRVNSERHWKMAREVAMATTAGKIWLTEVGSATHYHAVYVRPAWGKSMKKVGRIGLHVFYRTYGGGWS